MKNFNPYELIMLQRRLRAGELPENMGGKKLGQGVQKAGYLIGNWVVKRNSGGIGGDEKYPIVLWRHGMPLCKTYKARCKATGASWLIQEQVTRFKDAPPKGDVKREYRNVCRTWRGHYDIHEGNCGVNDGGKLVCFDW